MEMYDWLDVPSALDSINFEVDFRATLENWKSNMQDMDSRLFAGDYPDYIWDDAAARTAQTGMAEDERGFQSDNCAVYKYESATWVLKYYTFPAGLTSDGTDITAISMSDGGTIGQAAGPLLTFDDTNNYLGITGCELGVGTLTPQSLLTSYIGSSGATVESNSGALLESNLSVYLDFLTPNGNIGGLRFGDPEKADQALFRYSHSGDRFEWYIDDERLMLLEDTGSVGIGLVPLAKLDIGMDLVGDAGAYTDWPRIRISQTDTSPGSAGQYQIGDVHGSYEFYTYDTGTTMLQAYIAAVTTRGTVSNADTGLYFGTSSGNDPADYTNPQLIIEDSGEVHVTSTVASSSSTSGAFTVGGGAGILGNLYVGGDVGITGTLGITGAATFDGGITATSVALNIQDALSFESGKHWITYNDGAGNFNIRVGNKDDGGEECTEAGYCSHMEWSQSGGLLQWNWSGNLAVGDPITWLQTMQWDKDGILTVPTISATYIGVTTLVPTTIVGAYNAITFKGTGATSGFIFSDADDNIDGYLYATGGSIGFLDSTAGWALRMIAKDCSLYGALSVAGDLTPSVSETYSIGAISSYWKMVHARTIRAGTSTSNLADPLGTNYLPAHGGILLKGSGTQTRTGLIFQGDGTTINGRTQSGLVITNTYQDIEIDATADIHLQLFASGGVGVGVTPGSYKFNVLGNSYMDGDLEVSDTIEVPELKVIDPASTKNFSFEYNDTDDSLDILYNAA